MRLFKLDRELKSLSDLTRTLTQIPPADPAEDVSEAERSARFEALRQLLNLKRDSLQHLTKAYRDYLSELALTQSLAQELTAKTQKLALGLDESSIAESA